MIDRLHCPQANNWIALVIGNSRLHWAAFCDRQLQQTWDTPHLSAAIVQQLIATQFDFQAIAPSSLSTPASLSPPSSHPPIPPSPAPPSLHIASVVPAQTALWQTYPQAQVISLEQVPLRNTYPTLGIDRALAVWGAIATLGSPVLVIDAGTALTLTGATGDRLVGGAILPGVRLQFETLGQGTVALPVVAWGQEIGGQGDPGMRGSGDSKKTSDCLSASPHLPISPSPLPLPRWANTTESAIASGIIYTILAGLEDFLADWWRQFPGSPVVTTGGDGARLYGWLAARSPEIAARLTGGPNLIFYGIQAVLCQSSQSV